MALTFTSTTRSDSTLDEGANMEGLRQRHRPARSWHGCCTSAPPRSAVARVRGIKTLGSKASTSSSLIISTLRRARSASPLVAIKELRQFLLFPKTWNAVRGQFATFDEAVRSAPRSGVVGYDGEQHASLYDERIGKILISDYAVLFWLSRISSEVESIFDLGGHKGELFYGFREALPALNAVRWLVHDLPSATRAGDKLARSMGAQALTFTNEVRDGNGSNLLIASGVLQYLDYPLSFVLGQWETPPRYIIVNNTPMLDDGEYVTLQNTGISYNPYRVFNRMQLIASIEEKGYALRDHWRTDRSLSVPLRPDLSVEAYQGFFMEKLKP